MSSKYKPVGTYLKYHNTKVIYKGIKFDSKKERARFITLKQLENAGIIKELELQPKFLLLDTIHYKGKTYPKTYYKADFKYFKIKMLLTKYPDIEFVEVI